MSSERTMGFEEQKRWRDGGRRNAGAGRGERNRIGVGTGALDWLDIVRASDRPRSGLAYSAEKKNRLPRILDARPATQQAALEAEANAS